jgi:hypothetical protein
VVQHLVVLSTTTAFANELIVRNHALLIAHITYSCLSGERILVRWENSSVMVASGGVDPPCEEEAISMEQSIFAAAAQTPLNASIASAKHLRGKTHLVDLTDNQLDMVTGNGSGSKIGSQDVQQNQQQNVNGDNNNNFNNAPQYV